MNRDDLFLITTAFFLFSFAFGIIFQVIYMAYSYFISGLLSTIFYALSLLSLVIEIKITGGSYFECYMGIITVSYLILSILLVFGG